MINGLAWMVVIAIIMYIILCSIIAGIANKKGAHGYFWISLIFSPLMGVIMAAAEPDRGTKK